MISLKSYCFLGKQVIQLNMNSGLVNPDKVPPLTCIFIVSLMGTSCCGLNSTSVDKPVLKNIKIGWPDHKIHVLIIKINDLIITKHGPITVYSDL